MQKADFDKNTTSAIKGIALILMFIHHFFAYPEWYIESISYPDLAGYVRFFRYSAKICVPVFAFLTGYFYAYARNKSLRYSLHKITDLLISYWTVFIPILLFALMTGYREMSAFGFALGILGRNISLMTFCWYVSFYCLSMLMLPFLAKDKEPAPLKDLLLLVFMPVAASTILEGLIESSTLRTMVEEIRLWFPCIASGYLCAKYRVFDAANKHLKERPACLRAMLYALCMVSAMIGRYICDHLPLGSVSIFDRVLTVTINPDLVYAPLFVYGLSMTLQYTRRTFLFPVFQRIGDQSLLMWFIHCIFFNVSNGITQPILYGPGHPVLVVIFGLAICYALALILSPIADYLIQTKNHILQKAHLL